MRKTVVHWSLDLNVSAKGLGKFVHMENLDLTNFGKTFKQNVSYSEDIVNDGFQRPAFPDLNNFCNKRLYTKLLSQFRAVHSYGTRDTGRGKKNA